MLDKTELIIKLRMSVSFARDQRFYHYQILHRPKYPKALFFSTRILGILPLQDSRGISPWLFLRVHPWFLAVRLLKGKIDQDRHLYRRRLPAKDQALDPP